MRENTDHKNSAYRQFPRSVKARVIFCTSTLAHGNQFMIEVFFISIFLNDLVRKKVWKSGNNIFVSDKHDCE